MYTSRMLLLLVRHAVTPVTGKKLTGWLPGFSLSEAGRQRAAELAETLAPAPLKAIYSSPLERCRETAEPIARSHKLKVKINQNLGEVHYGEWQGRSLKSLYRTKAWAELRARPADFRFPGGETIREAQARGVAEVERLRVKHAGEVVLVCSHADLIRLVVSGYLGLAIDLYDRITVPTASVTTLWLGDARPRLLNLGAGEKFDELWRRFS